MFDVEITFSGAIGYVFNSDDTKMMAVIPDGRNSDLSTKVSIDGTSLKTHYGFIKCKGRNLYNNNLPVDSDIIIFLNRLRLSFYQDGNNPFRPTRNGSARDVHRVPLMSEVSDNFHRIDLSTLQLNNPDSVVLSQILINNGTLKARNYDGNFLHDHLNSDLLSDFISNPGSILKRNNLRALNKLERPLSPGYSLEYKNVNEFEILLTDLNSGADLEPLTITSNSPGEKVEILIANHCFGNPLNWDDLDDGLPSIADPDFKWLYQLNANKPGLVTALGEHKLPIPIVARDLGAGGQPSRCMGVVYTNEYY